MLRDLYSLKMICLQQKNIIGKCNKPHLSLINTDTCGTPDNTSEGDDRVPE
jgi:hypothetical protein